jgi:hypothetical protein
MGRLPMEQFKNWYDTMVIPTREKFPSLVELIRDSALDYSCPPIIIETMRGAWLENYDTNTKRILELGEKYRDGNWECLDFLMRNLAMMNSRDNIPAVFTDDFNKLYKIPSPVRKCPRLASEVVNSSSSEKICERGVCYYKF